MAKEQKVFQGTPEEVIAKIRDMAKGHQSDESGCGDCKICEGEEDDSDDSLMAEHLRMVADGESSGSLVKALAFVLMNSTRTNGDYHTSAAAHAIWFDAE